MLLVFVSFFHFSSSYSINISFDKQLQTRRINLRNSDAELIARSVKREAPLVVAVGADFVTGFTPVLRWLVKLGAYVVLVGEFRTR